MTTPHRRFDAQLGRLGDVQVLRAPRPVEADEKGRWRVESERAHPGREEVRW